MLRTSLYSAFLLACTVAGIAAAAEKVAAPSPEGAVIAANHTAVFTAPPRRIPSNGPTDAPLLGNGDFLAAFAGPPEKLQFYLSKADLWELRENAGPRGLGWMDIELPAMKGASYHVIQDLRHATTTGIFVKDGKTLTVKSAVAATENILWVKLSVTGGEVSGSSALRQAGKSSLGGPVLDNGNPVSIGREAFGGGRYYFNGEIADVVIAENSVEKPQHAKPTDIKSFDGRTTWHSQAVPAMSKAVHVGAWIRINRASPEANYIVSKGEWNQAYSLGLSGGCLRWTVNGTMLQTDKPLERGKWLYVAGSYDNRGMRVFIDGKLVAEERAFPADKVQVIARKYDKNMVRPTGAACAMNLLDEAAAGKFTVAPGKPVTLILAASGLANTPDYVDAAIRRATTFTAADFAALRQAHDAWWADFWGKSFVEIPDKKVEQRYYLSHYCMASCSRLAHFPPALYGWTLSEQTPMWGGAYFNNYNFFAPFYGLFAGNHVEQAMPCCDAVIDNLELGRAWAKDEGKFEGMCRNALKLKDAPGILLPVSMMPYGITGAPTTWGQRTNASYACVPLASTWYATYDLDFAKRAYPFVRETAIFWEHFLVLENGRYVDRNDAVLENSGRDTNPIVALALIRQVMNLALDMSVELGADADHRAKWTDIRDRLSDYPTCTVGDLPKGSRIALPNTAETRALPIFRYSEKGCAWQNDNAVGIQHIFPGNGIGLGTRPELLERARNQIRVMARWIDLNGCNSFYPAAVRVGYEPEEILKRLRHWVDTASANGMRDDNPHGTEQFSVVPCTIQEMLMQSYDGTLRLFPNWPKNHDARFGTLRACGAFLVSAELKNGVVTGVKIVSEKGRDCVVRNPWLNQKVALTNRETLAGERLTFKTQPGETIELMPEK